MDEETKDTTATSNSGKATKKRENGKWKDTVSTLLIILMAPIIALFLTNFVFQSYQVDGPSMETTLQDRDRLIVTKSGKTWSQITGNTYIPERNAIIIFNFSDEVTGNKVKQKQLVKRVIGLPGDRVVVKDGVVTIFNNEHPDGFLVDQEGPQKVTITSTSGLINEVVPDDEVYVMGDNRDNSRDSRTFGPVPSAAIVGHLAMRIYPFDTARQF